MLLDHLLENLRAMSEMIRGDADVGPDRAPHQRLRVVPELGQKQLFHGWPNAIDDRPQVR